MKNSQYWRERFGRLQEAQIRAAQTSFKEIEAEYRRAQRELEGKINTWYRQYGKGGVSMADARRPLSDKQSEKFKTAVSDYISCGKGNYLSKGWVKQLEGILTKRRISGFQALITDTRQSVEQMFVSELNIVFKTMAEIYENGYYSAAYELCEGTGTDLAAEKINSEKTEKILSEPWAADGKNLYARIGESKEKSAAQIHNLLAQNILLGGEPERAAESIKGGLKAFKSRAEGLTVTEGAYFGCAALRDCFEQFGVGEYEVVAASGGNISGTCRDLDGKRFRLKDFKAGVTAPPFHPRCRSTVCPCFDEGFMM